MSAVWRRCSCVLAFALALATASHCRATAFILPTLWDRGDPLSTYQEWNGFTSADGSTPNAPNVGVYNPAAPGNAGLNVYDSSGTSFLTSGGAIYSFSAPTDIHIEIPNYGLAGDSYTTVIVQTHTSGSELNYASVNIDGVAPVATQELHRVTQSTPFGVSQVVDYLFQWVLPGNLASYSIEMPAAGSSMGLDSIAVDTMAAIDGDANYDGKVNLTDLTYIASHWHTSGPVGSVAGDANYDGSVNLTDLTRIASHWGEMAAGGGGDGASLGPVVGVPEPTTWSLAITALLVFAGVARVSRRRARAG